MSTHKRVLYFAHGLESGPSGTKIQYLSKIAEKWQFHIESPDYSGMRDPSERADKLRRLKPEASECLVLLGSSMGAWVSLEASQHIKPNALFLIAPAVYIGEGYSHYAPKPYAQHVEIVHGWHDEVVPVENAIRFAREHNAPLHLLNSGHSLNDQLENIGNLLEMFFNKVTSSTSP